ncbi:MAG TPA: sigma-70 family RNA polymerase sigma factor [Candidatus Fournierella excrementavium]|uniref:RNA polymerase sigma factor n=1 Tax=Candidatus Allofournierella excrementavium TaxID=2838591 RepID=UPI001F8809F3|nr:sigma-70 family RNA polymerase sigma factor [Candidatus Fournierella excrementavium]
MGTPLEELFSAFHRDVYTYLFSLCRDAALAEDLTGETFLEAVRSFGAFRGEADCKTWLFTIARRRWFAWLKKKKRRPETEALSEFLECGEPGPAARADAAELFGLVRALLAAEPPRSQKIASMRLEGYSFYEIGLACGVSESSARVIDFRVKKRIRAALEQEGYYER